MSAKTRTVLSYIGLGTSIVWLLWIMIDYSQKHPLYFRAIQDNAYYGPLVLVVLTSLMVPHIIKKQLIPTRYFGAWMSLIFMGIVLLWQLNISRTEFLSNYPDFSVSSIKFLGAFAVHMGQCLLVLLSAFGFGSFLLRIASIDLPLALQRLVSLALGLTCTYILMMLLGGLGMLTQYVIYAVLILGLVLGLPAVFRLVQKLLLTSMVPEQGHQWYGYLGFFLASWILMMGLAQSVTIYPKGYDAMNFYSNIPHLIAEHEGLVEGFRPYTWSLIQSIGHIAFDSPEVANLLSSFGGLLVAVAAYQFAVHQLRFDPSLSMLGVAIFISTPVFTTQLAHELKIDLPLLYLHITTLYLAVRLIKKDVQEWRYYILLGVLLGFSLAIKISSILLAFGVLVALWYRSKRTGLPMAMFCFILSAILFFKIDRFSGLDYLIGGRYIYAVILVLVGIGLSINHALADRHYIWDRLKISALVLLVASTLYAPWIVKNMSECNQRSFDCIVNGAPVGKKLNIAQMKKNYRQSLKTDNE